MGMRQRTHKSMFKVLILGDPAVGKTSLIRRYVDNYFASDYKSTIGVDFLVKKVDFYFDKTSYEVQLQIWDIAGQGSGKTSFRQLYYQKVNGILLTYDITRKETFERLGDWLTDVKKVSPNAHVIVIGNKVDLAEQRDVEPDLAMEWARKVGAVGWIETSAKTGKNVQDAFESLAAKILGLDDLINLPKLSST